MSLKTAGVVVFGGGFFALAISFGLYIFGQHEAAKRLLKLSLIAIAVGGAIAVFSN